jgi:hypothetical protein
VEGEGEAVLALRHFGRRIEPQPLGKAVEVGDRDEQIERLVGRQQRRPRRAFGHRFERIEQQAGEARPAERRREPAGADEIRQLGADLTAVALLHRLLDGAAAPPRERPGERHRRRLRHSRHAAHSGIEQPVDVRGLEPELGERIERPSGGDRLGKENRVDAARARARQDVDQHPQLDAALRRHRLEQPAVDAFAAARRRFPGVEGAAGAGEPPHLLGDAVHVDGEADSPVADQRQP